MFQSDGSFKGERDPDHFAMSPNTNSNAEPPLSSQRCPYCSMSLVGQSKFVHEKSCSRDPQNRCMHCDTNLVGQSTQSKLVHETNCRRNPQNSVPLGQIRRRQRGGPDVHQPGKDKYSHDVTGQNGMFRLRQTPPSPIW